MKAELQKQLYDKYPKIFRQKDLSMKQTCMCWGIETPDTWYDLIDEACAGIQQTVNELGLEQVEAVQVKEKYGTLRFYTSPYYEETEKFVNIAEQKSAEICAVCSSKDDVKATGGWVTYLCAPCREKEGRIAYDEADI